MSNLIRDMSFFVMNKTNKSYFFKKVRKDGFIKCFTAKI